MDIRQQRTLSPEKEKTKQVDSTIISVYCLERSPSRKATRGRLGRARQSSWGEKKELRVIAADGGYSSLGSVFKKVKFQRGRAQLSSETSNECWWAHICEEITEFKERSMWKDWIYLWDSHKSKNILCSY